MTDKTFAELPYTFPHDKVPSLKVARSCVQLLSGFNPVKYHCCLNSCCCYVGPYEDANECPYCNEPRYHPKTKKPRKVFTYLPLIPRLKALYSNAELSKEMRYRADEHQHEPGHYTDIFDGEIYQNLLGKHVIIDDKEARHTFFSGTHDLALGLATDGFGPIRKARLGHSFYSTTTYHPMFGFTLDVSYHWGLYLALKSLTTLIRSYGQQ